MAILIGVSLGLILGGLLMCYLSPAVQQGLLKTVVYWTGIVIIIVGLFLLFAPAIVYIAGHLRAMLDLQHN